MYTSSWRRTAALAVCFSVLAAGLAAPAQQQSEEMQIVRAAEQLVQQQKPDEALAELQKVFEKNDAFAPAYFIAGLALGQLGRHAEARENFVRATEITPGWGEAHRFASIASLDLGDLDAAWDHAIKAHQAGVDMSDGFAGLRAISPAPDDLDSQLAAYRVFIGPFDTTVFEESADTQTGSSGSAARSTDVGARIVQEAAADIFSYQEEARRQFAGSRSFGLVSRQDTAQYIFVTQVDSISDNTSRRRLRGVVRLVDAQSGEEAYRRRVDFANIVTRADLNRDFTQLMSFMEEWAAEAQR